jgi:hypothetical protein
MAGGAGHRVVAGQPPVIEEPAAEFHRLLGQRIFGGYLEAAEDERCRETRERRRFMLARTAAAARESGSEYGERSRRRGRAAQRLGLSGGA